ncbi:hypothetical protein SAMD00019534_071250 [Acytostelium subglobosum LB1]|uniref:hypothetical protein n=1 Tax=Acytostelium subglobosum LB1 TaxID=1410327 RepID=UPI0006447E12|nr:hypothetical protein SAMD00019534_071250 [Acytostelium subglobosum LB1]GAM23950.1 hypothetical protein SAMD00019534_071250 [Acytostelium subglobosum LB1]|eukprot:XP_012752986.1 hypothetical protein SAMD00019534_071250 [Acytostelium subglobosum LB1]
MSLPSTRTKVLYLYRRIFRMANQWEKPTEKEDIRTEARISFRRNKDLKDVTEIDEKIEEARSRMLLALHYKIPYPKKSYAPKSQGVMPAHNDPNNEANIN